MPPLLYIMSTPNTPRQYSLHVLPGSPPVTPLITPTSSPAQICSNIFAMASSALHPRTFPTDVGHRRSRSREFWSSLGFSGGSMAKMASREEVEDDLMDIDEPDGELPLRSKLICSANISCSSPIPPQVQPIRSLPMLRHQCRHPTSLLSWPGHTHNPHLPARPILLPRPLLKSHSYHVTGRHLTCPTRSSSDNNMCLSLPR